jgi:anaerobic selenocysteine-containing dehydrogenase
MAQVLLTEGLATTDGVEGVEELKTALAAFAPEQVAAQTGVAADAIRQAARQLAGAKKSAILLAYGLPYTAQSRELAVAAANLAILTGMRVVPAAASSFAARRPAARRSTLGCFLLPAPSAPRRCCRLRQPESSAPSTSSAKTR